MSSFTRSFNYDKVWIEYFTQTWKYFGTEENSAFSFSFHPWWRCTCIWYLSHHHVSYYIQYVYYSTSYLICRRGSQRWQNCQYSLWGTFQQLLFSILKHTKEVLFSNVMCVSETLYVFISLTSDKNGQGYAM